MGRHHKAALNVPIFTDDDPFCVGGYYIPGWGWCFSRRQPSGRHRYDFHPTPERPIVRLYPAIPWLNTPPKWVRDDGNDTMDQNIIAEVAA